MTITSIVSAAGLALLLCSSAAATDKSTGPGASRHGDDGDLPKGVIGISLQVGAARIGDPAVLYVAMVHPDGPAHRAGLVHGDEVLTVDGASVFGKTYEQIVRMTRGEVGTVVKLGVKGESPTREIAITRIASAQLPMGPRAPHGSAK